jgi:RNA polymerase sigma-70 factor, ECF subfamily
MSEPESSVDGLIGMARQDGEALGRLLERYRAFLLLTAKAEIGPRLAVRCDASDVVQQTMVEAFQGYKTFKGASEPEFSAWIKRIHRRNITDLIRKRSSPECHPLEGPRHGNDAEASASFCWNEPAAKQSTTSQRLIKGEKALRLAEILESLPDMQREAVRLRHIEGWPVDKIARALDRSLAATAGLIKRGLQALREKMSQESWL